MSEFERVINAIRALPDGGEGWTLEAIAAAVNTDTSMVVSATEEIIERDEQDADE